MKKIRTSARCLVVAAAFAASLLAIPRAGAAASITTISQGTLQVCLYPGFKPFAWKEGSVWKGWDVDYVKDFAKVNSLKLQIVEIGAFDDIWMLPGRNTCDIAGTGISNTEARRKATGTAGAWSSRYYTVVRSYLVRAADKDKLKDINGMRNQVVIVTGGSTADTDLRNRLQQARIEGVTILGTNSEEAAAKLVLKGCAFAYGGGYGSVKALAEQLGGLAVVWPHCNMTKTVKGGKDEFKPYAEPFSFVVRTASTGLLEALNGYIPHHQYAGTPNPPDVKCVPPPGVSELGGK